VIVSSIPCTWRLPTSRHSSRTWCCIISSMLVVLSFFRWPRRCHRCLRQVPRYLGPGSSFVPFYLDRMLILKGSSASTRSRDHLHEDGRRRRPQSSRAPLPFGTRRVTAADERLLREETHLSVPFFRKS
jgi:hypothetical protein